MAVLLKTYKNNQVSPVIIRSAPFFVATSQHLTQHADAPGAMRFRSPFIQGRRQPKGLVKAEIQAAKTMTTRGTKMKIITWKKRAVFGSLGGGCCCGCCCCCCCCCCWDKLEMLTKSQLKYGLSTHVSCDLFKQKSSSFDCCPKCWKTIQMSGNLRGMSALLLENARHGFCNISA